MVDKRYQNEIKYIRNQAEGSVISPSNIFSIDNPDELHLIGSHLIGLFIPHTIELQRPQLLLRRILNSKLSYVNNLKIVLLIDEHSSILEINDIINAVDVLIHPKDQHKLHARLNNPKESVIDFSPKVRLQTLKNYGRNINISEYFKGKVNGFKNFSLENHSTVQYNNIKFKTQDITYSKVRIGDSATQMMVKNYEGNFISLVKSLQSFLTYSFFMRYEIDNYEVHWTNCLYYTGYSFFNTDQLDKIGVNLNKICFAGFIPINAGNQQECTHLVEEYLDYGKKLKKR